ncbi:MAG: MipA/OmpV family protein [Pseudomonadota bacterium]
MKKAIACYAPFTLALCFTSVTAASAAETTNQLEAGLATFSLDTLEPAPTEVERSGGRGESGERSRPQAGPPSERPAGGPPAMPPGMPPGGPVFDETWVSVGLGAGLVPSYAGSDDYILFPLPLIVGRVGGVGISPNGPGFVLDVLSPEPGFGPRKTRISAGPAFRIRNDRVAQIEDEVVETLEDLDLAVEVGANVGVAIPGVFGPRDTLVLSTQVRWDVAGAHEGMLIEPTVGYRTNFGRGIAFQAAANLQFVDDDYARYYFSVTPDQSVTSGLPQFDAEGGLNSVGVLAVTNFDLDGNLLNGGLNIYTVLGYSRLVNDAADTPFTDIRGDANQFIGGLGIGYTF